MNKNAIRDHIKALSEIEDGNYMSINLETFYIEMINFFLGDDWCSNYFDHDIIIGEALYKIEQKYINDGNPDYCKKIKSGKTAKVNNIKKKLFRKVCTNKFSCIQDGSCKTYMDQSLNDLSKESFYRGLEFFYACKFDDDKYKFAKPIYKYVCDKELTTEEYMLLINEII